MNAVLHRFPSKFMRVLHAQRVFLQAAFGSVYVFVSVLVETPETALVVVAPPPPPDVRAVLEKVKSTVGGIC